MDTKKLNVQELSTNEMRETQGGMTIFLILGRIEGVLDGEKGNTKWKWFWQ